MARPNAAQHDPRPEYIRELLDRAGMTQDGAAARIGISERMMRYYVADGDANKPAPYLVQFALECLAR